MTKTRSKSSAVKKQRPLQLDCTSLLNHLTLVQNSIPYIKQHQKQHAQQHQHDHDQQNSRHRNRPNLQMMNFTKGTLPRTHHSFEWYILVASTPFAISAQLVPVPKSRDCIVEPDVIQCTPISIWTCAENNDNRKHVNLNNRNGDADADGNGNEDYEYKGNIDDEDKLEYLNCHPIILIQEQSRNNTFNSGLGTGSGTNTSSGMDINVVNGNDIYANNHSMNMDSSSEESLSVSVVLGTTHNRVLCVQLSIFSYVGIAGREEGRYVLSKADENNDQSIGRGGILEPLPLDTDESIRKKKAEYGSNFSMGYMNSNASLSSSHHNDGHSTTSGTAGTGSRDTNHRNSDHQKKWVPFRPYGGVASLSPLYKCRNHNIVAGESSSSSTKVKVGGSNNGDFVWITYGDGTMLRLPRWAFFPLLDDDYNIDVDVDNDLDVDVDANHGIGIGRGIQSSRSSVNGDVSVGDVSMNVGVGLKDKLVKAMVIINPKNKQGRGPGGSSKPTIMPLPKFFPSMMSQPLQTLGISSTSSLSASKNLDYCDEDSGIFSGGGQSRHSMAAPAAADYEFFEAVTFGHSNNNGNGRWKDNANSTAPPTLSFYTNEDQLFSKTHDNGLEENGERSTVQSIIQGGSTIIGGTASIAKGVFGGMLGAVLGRSKQTEEELMRGMEIVGDGYGDKSASISSSAIFPSMHEETLKLPLGTAIFDTPRRILNASVDPVDGVLMACADNLGRVQLIDLSTKQVIRIWKGFREATCHWIQFPFEFETGAQIVKYLTIHCRERKIVEIYRMRHGPRVGKFATTSDAQVVQCVVALKGDESYTKCFILQTNGNTKRRIAKELMVHDDELNKVVLESLSSSNKSTKAMNEKYLAEHESLSEGTIQLQLLKQLLASESAVPADLDAVYAALTQITAISDLSRAVDLLAVATHLESMGVEDSSFHVEVIGHAQEQLNIALSDEIIATSNNPLLDELQNKIEFHSRLIASYDVLHRFETGGYSDNDNEEDLTKSSLWVIEALSWIQTAEKVHGRSIDADISLAESNLTFSIWSKGCLQDSQGSTEYKRNSDGDPVLYLCDSTRDRKNILLHIFKPLTKDIFIFKTTQQMFEQMGIHNDYNVLLQYYGEWFMSLPKAILEKECLGIWCPTVRWLHDIVQESVDIILHKKSMMKDEILLHSLHTFCVEAADLPRAFLLASVCCEAIYAATKQLEAKTYGEVTCEACVKPWEQLLRKLRMCLLITLRLYGKPVGAVPVTVSNVESGMFSIYEWISRDLLSFSHNQLEIAALEIATGASVLAFHPASTEGDKTALWKMVQKSCKMRSFKCPTDESQPGPLLFFMKHYNDSRKLAAHRALLLSQEWGREPGSLDLLKDAIASLHNMGRDEETYSSLLAAVLLEIWEIHIRPIYRALLFGFDEVHELCEEIIAPLCLDPVWFHSLNKISMKVIMLLLSTTDNDPYEDVDEMNGAGDVHPEAWPKIKEDITINALFRKTFKLEESSLEAHRGIICAVRLNDDLSLLPLCVDSFDTVFLRQSFSISTSRSFTANEHQISFIQSATRQQAELAEGPMVTREYLDDIVSLGRSWGLDKGHILTQFLLVMYELGKDDYVEDLFNSITRLLDVDMFMDHGIAIVCVRLRTALTILKKAKQCRSILAMLDADTCEWVREQARTTCIENPDIVVTDENGRLLSLDNTHALILRMKRMSSVNRIDAYALSVMCETLVKAMNYLEGI